MSREKSHADVWAARFDDRDDEELACQLWARRLAMREQALAQPFKGMAVAEERGDAARAQSEHPR